MHIHYTFIQGDFLTSLWLFAINHSSLLFRCSLSIAFSSLTLAKAITIQEGGCSVVISPSPNFQITLWFKVEIVRNVTWHDFGSSVWSDHKVHFRIRLTPHKTQWSPPTINDQHTKPKISPWDCLEKVVVERRFRSQPSALAWCPPRLSRSKMAGSLAGRGRLREAAGNQEAISDPAKA